MAAVNVDAKLVRQDEEDFVELENGCMCCTMVSAPISREGRNGHVPYSNILQVLAPQPFLY